MNRLLHLIVVIVGTLALVGGSMMLTVGLLLFVGSYLFPAVADFGLPELKAFVLGGGVVGIVGWVILNLLTRRESKRSTSAHDSDLVAARHKSAQRVSSDIAPVERVEADHPASAAK